MRLPVSIIGLLFLAPALGFAQERAFFPSPTYTILDSGRRTDSIRDPQVVVVRSQPDFESLWDRTYVSSGPQPELDWSYQQVVGIYAGQRPTTGYDIQLRSVQFVEGRYVISVTETPPIPGRMASSLESSPFLWLLMVGHFPVQVVWNRG